MENVESRTYLNHCRKRLELQRYFSRAAAEEVSAKIIVAIENFHGKRRITYLNHCRKHLEFQRDVSRAAAEDVSAKS